ncbi:cyanophycin synthetase [uncultured Thiocystis sp.]|jgi:cyanophycin synthetase|uniref:cyanophycin synthetase n=1 Tax=uncultured Thiocystis sp. TaxID=1202134 RepID=UPI0025F25F26|nr:cyanophycin synthetase [uncultured Thiocystis sp.]
MLTIQHQWVLRGPNLWAHFPVIELRLDLGAIKDTSSEEIPGFNDRLKSWLPSLIEHRCSVGERGGFFRRLDRGTYMAHILEHVSLELQTLAGTPVGYGRARETDDEGVYRVAIEYAEEALGLAAIAVARELILAAIHDAPFEVTAELERLRDLCHEVRLGPSTAAIAKAARARGIPVRRLGSENLLQLGWGCRQRRAWTAETDRTSAIAESIAQDKELTRMLLRAVGVPVPEGQPVATAEDAWRFAQALGAPVVVKPRYGNHGRGVTANLTGREPIEAAFAAAREEGSSILCERYIQGADHRLLVVGGRLIAAALREPAQVVGDGRASIQELVDATNRDPRRSAGHATMLSLIELDAIAHAMLAEQGLTPESIPAAGQRVLLRRNANLSTGGTAADVTDRVHPAVAAQALEAARMVGLDLAGIDILAADIARPLEEQGGAVVEVNAGPGLRMHLEPSAGQPRPVGEAVVDLLFPEDAASRIPLIAVTGASGADATARLIAHLIQVQGDLVGLATQDGIRIGERRIDPRDGSGPEAARTLLMHPRLDAAVLALAAGPIRREGLGFDRCRVGVVTQIGETLPVGQPGIETLDDLMRVKRCVVEAVAPDGCCVLNADDLRVVGMAESCRGAPIWFASDSGSPSATPEIGRGGRAVLERDGVIFLATGETLAPLLPLGQIAWSEQGREECQIQPILAAVAAAWGLGLSLDEMRAGLMTIPRSFGHTTGAG